MPLHAFEAALYFEGCLPIEEMARRGRDTLAFGPMKPVGLRHPATGRRPDAVVQLRHEDKRGVLYNLVGFQTQLRTADQQRVFRTLPGLGEAVFARYGSVHRNTYLNAPACLEPTLELRARPGLYLAGQIAGVEGYVESAALGLLAGLFAAAAFARRARPLAPPAEHRPRRAAATPARGRPAPLPADERQLRPLPAARRRRRATAASATARSPTRALADLDRFAAQVAP